MTVALLPQKHVRTSESLLGLGALVLVALEQDPKSLDTLWTELRQFDAVKDRANGSVSLDRVVLAIDFLFAIDAITLNNEGLLAHAPN